MRKLSSVLLVDDDETTNFLNQLLFRRLDVTDELLVALNGQEALARLLTSKATQPLAPGPALILLDMKMPVMDGFEFLEAYMELPGEQRNAVIIMLTTSLNPLDVGRVQNLPIADVLTKPLTKEKIHEVLHTHFGFPRPE